MARRGLGHVAEDRSLFFQLTVDENLQLGLRGAREREAAIDRALDLLPALRPLIDRRAGLLSGGEQQMLAVARAIVATPKVLMVDEMSLGLAPIIVERLLPIIRGIADETGHRRAARGAAHPHGAHHRRPRLRHEPRRDRARGHRRRAADRRDLLEASYLGDTVLPEESVTS